LYGIKKTTTNHTFSSGGEITIGYRINDGWDDASKQKVRSKVHQLVANNKETDLVDMVLTCEKDAKER
jgi:hypothetical protein